jgi:hypothetical protein
MPLVQLLLYRSDFPLHFLAPPRYKKGVGKEHYPGHRKGREQEWEI